MNSRAQEVHTSPAPVDVAPVQDEAAGLVIGIVALTVVAGLLEVIQRLRGGAGWPVPMIIYATLLPIITFVIVMAHLKEAYLHPGYLIAAWAPLPFIVLGFLIKGRRGAVAAESTGP